MRKKPKHKPIPPPPKNLSFHLIDKHNLDEEWTNQVHMVRYYGEKLARAKRRFDLCKTACSVFEAELARRIRQKPKNYSVGRLTEAALKEAVTCELLYSKEHDAWLNAKHEVDILEVAMKTLEHRKKSLESLVFLHNQSYFAGPETRSKKSKKQYQLGMEDD